MPTDFDPHWELEPGTRVNDRYVVEKEVGDGATSIVYRATEENAARTVALKVLRACFIDGSIAARRFEREVHLITRLVHPAIVEIYETGWLESRQPWIALEYLDGETLEARLTRQERLTLDDTISTLTPVLEALDLAHRHQILHRDLKPANIFVARTERGERTKLLDFGVGIDLSSAGPRLTAPSQLVGTLGYLSPEQITPGLEADRRSDLWAVGIVAYRALTGTSPFGRRSARIISSILKNDVPPPSAAVPELSPQVDAFFGRALAKDRDSRFQDALSMRDALRELA